jgi:signal transduction histidine kinase
MATVPYYLLAVLVPLPLAALATGGGALLGEVVVRRKRGTNAGDVAGATGRRVLLILLTGLVAQWTGASMGRALALVAAAVVMCCLDIVTFPLVVTPMSGERPLQVIRRTAPQAFLIEGPQYLVGLLGALVATQEVWALTLLTVPTALVYVAFKALAEAETARHAAEEARQVAEAARRAAEEAYARAEAAVQARDAFLTTASHDLRTPLTNILGRAQMIEVRLERGGTIDAAWLEEQLKPLRRAGVRMAATVEEITDAAYLQMGRPLALNVELVDLDELLGAVVHTTTKGESPILIEHTVPGIMVAGDRARLERVVQNLLDNALKYSPAATPIHVALHAEDQHPSLPTQVAAPPLALKAPTDEDFEDQWTKEYERKGSRPDDLPRHEDQGTGRAAVLTIRDEGVGIPENELPFLFTPFYRASTSRGTTGSGLGLASARSILEQHGGHVTIESVLGRGTAVQVVLPRAPEPEDGIEPGVAKADAVPSSTTGNAWSLSKSP